MRVLALLLAFVAFANALSFFEDGKEYEYLTDATHSSGTMDYSPHSAAFSYKYKVRLQKSGNRINIKVSDIKYSEYTGAFKPGEWIFDTIKYTSQEAPPAFAIEYDNNGLFSKVIFPSAFGIQQRNIVRSWANKLQINIGKINSGELGFRSKEQTLHGDCNVKYTVNDKKIVKITSHMNDCENRQYRMVDDWRGHRCDIDHDHPEKVGVEPLFSTSETVYVYEKQGDAIVPKAIVSSGMVMAQFFETEGVSHYTFSNATSILINTKSGSDISVSGNSLDKLAYEWADKDYKWDKERDLKAREPFFSTGAYFDDDMATLKTGLMSGLSIQKTILDDMSHSEEAMKRAHTYGINNLLPPMIAMDFNTLKSIAVDLLSQTSEDGKIKSNLFNELLGTTGTTASALVIRDLVMESKLDNFRDSIRLLTAVPFHIRRPNVQLLEEYENLFNYNGNEFVKEQIHLVFGHLVRITCERAGNRHSAESKKCFDTVAKKYINRYVDKVMNSGDHDEKGRAIVVLNNIRYGGVAAKLKDLIHGKTDIKCPHLRTMALWAAGWDAAAHHGTDYFLPVFANQDNDHELRIAAVTMLMYAHPSPADFSHIMVTLYTEKDYEVINYVFALLEKYANSINPCFHHMKETAAYFLKYLKQYSQFETDWGFGVSKTYIREFQQKKYGYGGSSSFTTIGSHKSTTPLTVGFGYSTTLFHGYSNNLFYVNLRIQGLAKGLVRKLKKIDPSTWKTDDLKKILMTDMNIRERPDQPVRVEVCIMVKGAVVIFRQYNEESVKEGGKLKDFMDKIKSLGDTYSINHQRILQVGSMVYEQPMESGFPMAYINSLTGMGSIQATVKKGNHRGLLFRDVDYKIHGFTQGISAMMIQNQLKKRSYGITQDRIKHIHIPRKFVIGINPIKKELKLSIERPEHEKPLFFLMHSQTTVLTRGHNMNGEVSISNHCPDCESRKVVSNGPEAKSDRKIIDHENTKLGYHARGEYFDCEMDVSKGRTISHALKAFMPYNKNPKTLYNSIIMGVRQVRSYMTFFPRAEKCGMFFKWSRSLVNPVREIEVTIRLNFEQNGEFLFFRGRKWFIKALIKAKGDPSDRQYRVNLAYEFTPGYIQNNFKLQVQRAGISGLMKDYSMCFSLENKYPEFAKEFFGYDINSQMAVTGKARVRYGYAAECDSAPGEWKLTFKHETTPQAREDMKNTWYYKKCEEQRKSPAWSHRGDRVPVTEACFMTAWDATTARKYNWNVDFVKMTDRMKAIVGQFQAVLKTGLLPYWDIDPETMPASSSDPHMNLDVTFKDNDKAMDLYVETSQGGQKFEDIPLRLNWYPRMRNLKFTKTIKRLMDIKIINPCVTTSKDVRTMDNVTYSYEPTSCWTLTSGHCSSTPSYAVFTKKSSGMPLAMRIYLGGHLIEFIPKGAKKIDVKVNGDLKSISEDKEYVHTESGTEIAKIFKWGSTYNVYSFLKLWVVYDGHFAEVVPAPSVKGQHCGLCGNYNRNKMDEFTGKDETLLSTSAALVEDYKWKC